jgi:hypothetical protein
MIRFFKRLPGFALSLWLAEILVELLKEQIHIKTGYSSPYVNTLVGMLVIVAVFYPTIVFAEWLVENTLKKSSDNLRQQVIWLVVMYALAFLAVFVYFGHKWYGLLF